MSNIPLHSNVRVNKELTRTLYKNHNSISTFSWYLAKHLYSNNELVDVNYYGRGIGKTELSPRRRHALEEAVYDTFGYNSTHPKLIRDSINTNLRVTKHNIKSSTNRLEIQNRLVGLNEQL